MKTIKGTHDIITDLFDIILIKYLKVTATLIILKALYTTRKVIVCDLYIVSGIAYMTMIHNLSGYLLYTSI